MVGFYIKTDYERMLENMAINGVDKLVDLDPNSSNDDYDQDVDDFHG